LSAATFKIGLDVGGTFTDVVVESQGRLQQGKAPSTPGRESEGVMDALRLMARERGVPLDEFLRCTTVINFGTTVATNAMLQMKGVPVGMITTRGFRDVVELRRGWKEVMFDLKLPPPKALAPRRWRFGVTERMGADGAVVTPLAEDEVREAARKLRAAGLRSVAVCFLSSHANGAHERRARELVLAEHPEAEVYLSADVLPKIREYERFSTTVVNAYLSPLLKTYLARLADELAASGFAGQLYVMQSNGGTVAPDVAGAMGCAALLSGPAAGVVAANRIGELCGAASVIGVDMGGTSYDVSLVHRGTPSTRYGGWFNRHWVGLPMLNIHTIGAGGGSIAWIDSGGALRVGPQSAGARPGPACYGLGGTEAAVTDAFLCLGHLDPDYFLGGRMRLDRRAAEKAVADKVGRALGMDVTEAAFSILRIVNNNMSNAIRYVTVARGLDPRDFVLMSFGGAGSVTATQQARDLGIRRVLVPRTASVFCALGELWADLRVSQILPRRALAAELDPAALARELDAMAQPYVERFRALDGVAGVRTDRYAELHYLGQTHELPTPIPQGNGSISAADWAAMCERYHALHKEHYAFEQRHKPIELLSVAQDVVGVRPWSPPAAAPLAGADARAARKGTRRAWFARSALDVERPSFHDTPVYEGGRLEPGNEIAGPAIIEEVDTTIVLQPGDRLRVTPHRIYDITVPGGAA
jgi:N-methylhydantoinase A